MIEKVFKSCHSGKGWHFCDYSAMKGNECGKSAWLGSSLSIAMVTAFSQIFRTKLLECFHSYWILVLFHPPEAVGEDEPSCQHV